MSRECDGLRSGILLAALSALGFLALAPTSAPAGTPTTTGPGETIERRANLPDLEEEVMCPVCGTLLGLSNAPAAQRQRIFIRRLIREGRTDDQIKDALVREYGPGVLAMPDDEGINAFAYIVPVAGLLMAAIGLLGAIVVWKRRDPGPRQPREAPSGSAAERLDRDLEEFGE